jgi:hypothetical protein
VIPSPSELAGFWSRLADLDADIRRCHAEGYETEVDRLLDERTRWQQERDEPAACRAALLSVRVGPQIP